MTLTPSAGSFRSIFENFLKMIAARSPPVSAPPPHRNDGGVLTHKRPVYYVLMAFVQNPHRENSFSHVTAVRVHSITDLSRA